MYVCWKIFLEKASAGREFSPSNSENLSRAKLYLSAFWSAIYLCRQMYCMSKTKFQVIFLPVQCKNSTWKSLVLFNTSFAVLSEICSCLSYCTIATSFPNILQYFFRIQRGQNVVLYNVFQCFKVSDEYLKLLTAYRCGSRDSAYRAKHCIKRHFAVLVNRHL